MKFEEVSKKEVVDIEGRVVGIVENIEFKEDGTYAFVVKGELDDDQRQMQMEKFGKQEGGDRFEIPLEAIGGIKEKVALRKSFSELKDKIKIIRHI